MIDIAAAKLRDQRFALDIIAESKSLQVHTSLGFIFLNLVCYCICMACSLLNNLIEFTCFFIILFQKFMYKMQIFYNYLHYIQMNCDCFR